VIAPTETARPMLLPRVTPAPEVVVHQATADTPRPAPRPDPQARRPAPAPQEAGNADRTARRGSAEGTPLSNAAAAAPQPTVAAAAPGNAEASNYPGLVMRRIQRVRQARVRAQGTALVAFTVGADGGLASVRLARASGNADLDAAALDHIRRAAPFPSPPPGAQRNFSFEFVGR
jgi:protein TonB